MCAVHGARVVCGWWLVSIVNPIAANVQNVKVATFKGKSALRVGPNAYGCLTHRLWSPPPASLERQQL